MIDHAADLSAWLEARAHEMMELLERLVAVDTENPPGRRLTECAQLLCDAMRDLGISAELIELTPTVRLADPCIVRGGLGEGTQIVYFHGHFDVVPAQSRGQFEPQRRDGKIIGRGTADMKGGIVSMLYGAAAASDLGLLSRGQIVFHFVCDEETGSAAGSQHLRDADLIDADALAMVTAEPTGGVIWHANRGAITLRVSARGKEAHVGQAHLGVNSFERIVRIAEPLAKLAHDLLDKRTAFPVESEEARGSMLVVGGAAEAGANFNVVPASAWFSVDRRFNPEEDLEEEFARLTDTINEAAAQFAADVTVDVLQKAPAASTSQTNPTSVLLARCVAAIEGAPPRFQMCPGVLETRWYAQLGIPAYAYGGGRLDVSHGPDEYINEGALLRCAAVYAAFVGEILQ
jgi:succinyl-diaminopimelate desuccinylase